jgi:hypothetical protein
VRGLQRPEALASYAPPPPLGGEGTPVVERSGAYKTFGERRLDFRLYSLPPRNSVLSRLRNARSRLETTLAFWDVPGEMFDDAIPDAVVAEMMRARGLILLVSPVPPNGGDPQDYYYQFFDNTLGRLQDALRRASIGRDDVPFDRATNRITLPVAICISQIDRVPDASQQSPQRLFEQLVGRAAPMIFEWLATYEIFPLTALGRSPRRVGAREYLDGDPEPKLVHLPIEWLLRAPDGRRA